MVKVPITGNMQIINHACVRIKNNMETLLKRNSKSYKCSWIMESIWVTLMANQSKESGSMERLSQPYTLFDQFNTNEKVKSPIINTMKCLIHD